MVTVYINTEPHEVQASLRLDDPAETTLPGTGTQHVEFYIPGSEVGHGATLDVEAEAYVPFSGRVMLTVPQLTFPDGSPCDIVLEPDAPHVALPRLVVDGMYFRPESGERWTAIECSDFHLFGRFLNDEDILPVLQQRRDLGFNLLRVWTRYDLAQYGIGTCTLAQHPELYDRVPEFLDLCAEFGLYVEFTAYTGREDFDPEHWTRLGAAVQHASTWPLLELVNEVDQAGNRIDLTPFAMIPGVLCSHGSNGSEREPVRPFWNYADFHTNGAPQWVRKNGHNAAEWVDPAMDPGGPSYPPMLTSESTRCPDHDADPKHFEDAAAGAALLCAGSAFHSVHGKSSELFDGIELVCAEAHVRGARSVPLTCQPEGYRRLYADDNGARVYQRGSSPSCIVHIGSS